MQGVEKVKSAASSHQTWPRGAAPIRPSKVARAVTLGLALTCVLSVRAQAQYSLDATREAVLIGGGLAGSIAAYAIHDQVVPLTPEEVARLSNLDVNSFDRGATYRYSPAADEASDWLVYGIVLSPLALMASPSVRQDVATYGTMYGEMLLLTLAATQLTKGLVLRTRPYAYNPYVPMEEKTSEEARKSFYSSHTAFAFASAVFMGVTFEAYEPGSPLRPWVWAASLSAAVTVGVLRYTSGSHFPTDILVGAAIGALAGYAVPALHRVGEGELSVMPAAGPRTVHVAFRIAL